MPAGSSDPGCRRRACRCAIIGVSPFEARCSASACNADASAAAAEWLASCRARTARRARSWRCRCRQERRRPESTPPLGVLSKMLPSRSMIAMCVVSLDTPAESSPSDASIIGSRVSRATAVTSGTFAFQYGQSFTRESNGSGSPATNAVDARAGQSAWHAGFRVGLRQADPRPAPSRMPGSA